ncbi:MAG TPA: hypothetical protein VFD11_11555 [Thiopseudomonas sp.]|nr:hypothetical protein [Thiopseudomonas sp.]
MRSQHSESAILRSLQYIQNSGCPSLLMVTHALGGGVERHVLELQSAVQGRAHVSSLRPLVHARQVLLTVPVYTELDGQMQAQGSVNLAFKWPQERAKLRQWLEVLTISRVHVHHVFGFAHSFWPFLYGLKRPLDLTLHDHSIFTGNPSLLDQYGRFDKAWLEQGLEALPVGDSKAAQLLQSLALRAQRVIVPSRSLATAVAKLLPSLQVLVRDHPERELLGAYPSVQPRAITAQQPLKVLCLGMLGIEKGAYTLAQTAALVVERQLNIEFVLLGACHVELPSSVDCLGLYQDAELPRLISELKPHLLWLPAQCPETWSYTLSAGLYAGLPVLASRLGALPERLYQRPLTRLLNHTASAEQWLTAMDNMRAQLLAEKQGVKRNWQHTEHTAFYLNAVASSTEQNTLLGEAYLQPASIDHPRIKKLPAGLTAAQQLAQSSTGYWRVLVLRVFYIVARWPVLARLVGYIPYRWQRRIKRAVSRAPLDSRTLSK